MNRVCVCVCVCVCVFLVYIARANRLTNQKTSASAGIKHTPRVVKCQDPLTEVSEKKLAKGRVAAPLLKEAKDCSAKQFFRANLNSDISPAFSCQTILAATAWVCFGVLGRVCSLAVETYLPAGRRYFWSAYACRRLDRVSMCFCGMNKELDRYA